MSQIICKNASIGYDKKTILSNVSFSVNAGDYLCIVGENGAGKSTLVKTILGLVPTISGQIELSDGIKKSDFGYLPQQTEIQKDFPATVMEVVMSGFQNRSIFKPFYTKKEREEARSHIKRLGIENLSKNCYRELSGGQQQRVLLSRALCGTQKILILDEPVAGLDVVATNEMYSLISDLNKEGITIIMISHDISSAIKYASHILFVSDKINFSTKDEFKNSELGKKFEHYVGGHGNE